MYSNSRNDVPRVAQRYGTIAAYTRRRASVLVVFVVFCVHMYSFAGLIRRTPPPTFSDTAITDRHSDTTIFQLRAHWVRISWSTGSEKSFGQFGHVPRWKSNPWLTACKASTLSTRPGSPLTFEFSNLCCVCYKYFLFVAEKYMCCKGNLYFTEQEHSSQKKWVLQSPNSNGTAFWTKMSLIKSSLSYHELTQFELPL